MAAASTMGWMNWLSLAALGTGIVALAVSLGTPGPAGTSGAMGLPGPTGPMGLDGATGPQGSGTLMISKTVDSLPIFIEDRNCMNFPDADVMIEVPGPGSVVVTSTVRVQIFHVSPIDPDIVQFFLGTSERDCSRWSEWAIPRTAADGIYKVSLFVQEVFPTAASGTFTFFLNGANPSRSLQPALLEEANMVAVFYPA